MILPEIAIRNGFVVHPLYPATADVKSPGKQPLLTNWQALVKTPDNIEEYIKKGYNLGVVCGKVSGIIVIDFDSLLFYKTIFPDGSNTLESQRTEGRKHVYVKYTPVILNKSDKSLKIDIQGDNRNIVMPPSIHKDGQTYNFINPDTPIRELKDEEIARINKLFNTSESLRNKILCCGNCFQKLYELLPNMNNGSDRSALLGLFSELKLNDASDEELYLIAKLIFKESFSLNETKESLKHVDAKKPHKCGTLRKDFGKYFKFDNICDDCNRNNRQAEKSKKTKPPSKLPPIPQEEISSEPTNIEELLKTFRKYLYVEEDLSITLPLAEVISNFAPIEPDIIGIIGASGSSKTELIRALGEIENQYVYPVSSITEHTLVSGLEENIDLAPCLRGRLMTIKDFTTILAKNKDKVSEIFADLRELTDGHIGKDFGSGVKKHYTGIHTSVLFGCTNAIEVHYSLYSVLGQRITFFRPKNERRMAMVQAMKNAGKETAFREELHKITLQLINTIITSQKQRLDNLSHVSDEYSLVIQDLAYFLAIVRTYIQRDYRGDMITLPEPEYPTRLAKTISKLVDAHSILYNRYPNNFDIKIAYRLAHDNIPTERLRVLSVMLDGNERTTSEVQQEAKLPNSVTKRILDDLKTLEIIDYFSIGQGKPDVWQMSNVEYRDILTKIINFAKPEKYTTSTDSEQPLGDNRTGGGTTVPYQEGTPEFFLNKIEKSEDSPPCGYPLGVNHDAETQQKKPEGKKHTISKEYLQKVDLEELKKWTPCKDRDFAIKCRVSALSLIDESYSEGELRKIVESDILELWGSKI